MVDSIFERQQRREFENRGRFYDWPLVKQSILEAKGARECADVAAEEAERERAAQEAELRKGLANAADDYLPSFFVESTAGEGTLPPPIEYAPAFLDWFRGAPGVEEVTLVDQLFEEKHER